MPGGGTPPVMSQIGIGGLLEVAGGIAILLGLFTRPVAFILSGEMAIGSLTHPTPHGLFKTKANLRSCSVSSSCTWPHGALASGASMS
jgi:uncharacterized membrane protein YphA (DoxX/SURF4 family)